MAQYFSTYPGTLSRPASFLGLILLSILLTSAGVTLRGSSSGEDASLVLLMVVVSEFSKRAGNLRASGSEVIIADVGKSDACF